MTYISKNTPREELISECKRLKKELFYEKKKNSENISKRSKIRKDWNEKYDKLRYQLMKKDQVIYGKDIHIGRLKKRTSIVASKYKKTGYRQAMNRFRNNNYKVITLSKFLFDTNLIMGIYNLTFIEYSFILWAGRYDFFNKKDYDSTLNNRTSFYFVTNRLMKKNIINIIAEQQNSKSKLFALTGIGIDIYNKISKFTNKFLSENETKS